MSGAVGRSWVRRLRDETGQAVIEALFPVLILLILTVGSVLIFLLYANALVAQNALTQTALSASAAGTWTQQQQTACVAKLPGRRSGSSPPACWLERAQNGVWVPVAPLCGTGAVIGDCFNRRNETTDGRFTQRPLEDNALQIVPLKLHVRYAQQMPRLCLPFSAGDRSCIGFAADTVERTVVVYSSTWRRD